MRRDALLVAEMIEAAEQDILHATAIDQLPPFVEQLRAVQDALDEPEEDLTTR